MASMSPSLRRVVALVACLFGAVAARVGDAPQRPRATAHGPRPDQFAEPDPREASWARREPRALQQGPPDPGMLHVDLVQADGSFFCSIAVGTPPQGLAVLVRGPRPTAHGPRPTACRRAAQGPRIACEEG